MRPARVMYGSHAVAEAVAACRPGVIATYQISPQTHIVERLTYLRASGQLNSEIVRAESEHSAFSVALGASLAGVRAYTASASQGVLLATEVFYTMAGMRLPVVMTITNRTVSTPLSIQPDHQDSMAIRDAGLIQFYVESLEEAYATHIQAFRVAEDPDVLLPAMVCMDGWILTHCYEPIQVPTAEEVDSYLPPFRPVQSLDPDRPLSWGAFVDDDSYMEYRWSVVEAMERAKAKIREVSRDYAARFGRSYGELVEPYCAEDAEIVLVAMGSVAGTMKETVDALIARGRKVGLVRIRCFRPFPWEDIVSSAPRAKVFAVLDRSVSLGGQGQIAADLRGYLHGQKSPAVIGFIGGIGGRDISPKAVEDMVALTERFLDEGKIPPAPVPLGLKTEVSSNG
ncbi:MAG TPA: pyruvate ferredoxin oxidoreductase [Firmicutes bacterium]|nr:pyruvate ferredoxin oxidoreductase [Candidatus Fermentithermobacillaceae bacterium]